MDLMKEDMEIVGAREGDEVDRILWRRLSRSGDPMKEKPKEEGKQPSNLLEKK